MVATDTVVGIVGAVLLVAVMAGVFAYEYNNPVDAVAEGSDADLMAHFAEEHPGLDPHQDLDGDGIHNYKDDDLDGDGTPNAADADVSYHEEESGTLGPAAGPNNPVLSFQFFVGNGSVHVISTVTTSATVNNPLLPGNFRVQLLDPDGNIVGQPRSNAPGGSNTLTVETPADSDIPSGNWTVKIDQNQAGPGGNVQVVIDVHYPDPVAGEHTHEK